MVGLIHRTYFDGIRHMGMKDISLIDNVILTFIAITATANQHCLSAGKTCKFRVPPEFGPGGGAQHMCNATNNDSAVNIVCRYEFCHLDADCHSSSHEVQAKMIDNIC